MTASTQLRSMPSLVPPTEHSGAGSGACAGLDAGAGAGVSALLSPDSAHGALGRSDADALALALADPITPTLTPTQTQTQTQSLSCRAGALLSTCLPSLHVAQNRNLNLNLDVPMADADANKQHVKSEPLSDSGAFAFELPGATLM